MKFLYNFGFSQEDERTEADALAVHGGRVLSIASAGDMALSLLALGAERVVAVDIDGPQVHLCRLKLAAVRSLQREEAIALLGFVPADPLARSAWLDRVVGSLAGDSRAFWEAHGPQVLGRGAIWEGRYERYVRRLVRLVGPILGKSVRQLVSCVDLVCQEEVFRRRFHGTLLRGVFRVAFHPAVFSRRGMDPQSLAHRRQKVALGEQYFRRFRTFCTTSVARENPWLQLHLLGQLVSPEAVPAYLSLQGFPTVRERLSDLEVVQADILTYLAAAADRSFNCFHLSNVPDWFPQSSFDELMRLIVRKTDRPARVAWRYLHVDRSLPADLKGAIRIDRVLGARLADRDRFPFYSIIAASI